MDKELVVLAVQCNVLPHYEVRIILRDYDASRQVLDLKWLE